MLKQFSTRFPRELQVTGNCSGFLTFWVAVFAVLLTGVSAKAQSFSCLPADVKSDDVVRVVRLPSQSPEGTVKKVSVRESLKTLKAKCVNSKLVDGKRKEIRFFRHECWGNPPADYLEIQQRQRADLAELKKKYTVIEMTCNAGGRPPQSIS